MQPKLGDIVKVKTKEEIIEGILMPRPEILEKGITVVKLSNGYNIGIDDKRIQDIKLVKKHQQKKEKDIKLKKNPKLPTVSMLSTGGTISSKIDYKTGGVYAKYTAKDFVQMCPELQDIANLESKQIMSIMSEDVNPSDWKKMAKETVKELNSKNSGVILTHGTDTLHFSSAALSFFIRDINKPVIFTAAQRSIDRGSSDAFLNLICSTKAAANFNGALVSVCMHGTMNDNYCLLHRGTKVRKMHTTRRDAFRSINEEPIAKIWPKKIDVLNKRYAKRTEGEAFVDDKFEEDVAMIQVYPGADPEIVDYYIDKGYKGIVLSATALGHVPTLDKKYSFMPALERAMDSKIPVVISSQTLYGRVHPFVYTNLRKLSIERKCIFAYDMLPEVAYVKLGWVLGHTQDYDEVKKQMISDVAGEITKNIDPKAYLN